MRVPTAVACAALLVTVGTADLERALSIGRGTDTERTRFHARYIVALRDATVEQIEVVTEFRRAVMIVEERARFGDRMYGLSQLESAVRPFHNRVTVRARLRFHPMNVLTSVPDYLLLVGERADRLLPMSPTARKPVYVQSGDSESLMGAELEIVFDAGILGQARLPIAVVLKGQTIAATSFDFSSVM